MTDRERIEHLEIVVSKIASGMRRVALDMALLVDRSMDDAQLLESVQRDADTDTKGITEA